MHTPTENQVLNSNSITVSGHLYSAVTAVTVNGVSATVSGTTFTASGISLAEGSNILTATATRPDGFSGSDSVSLTLDTAAPEIAVSFPPAGLVTNQEVTPQYTITDTQDPDPSIAVTPQPPYSAEGSYQMTITATDWAGNQTQVSRNFTIDKTAPVITISSPLEGSIVDTMSVDLSGSIDDPAATVTVNGVEVTLTGGVFAVNGLALNPGPNTITIVAHDALGNRASLDLHVSFIPLPPTVTFHVDPQTIDQGRSATLIWNTSRADSCLIEPGIGAVPVNGSATVMPSETTTYAITASGLGGIAVANQTITVTPAGVHAQLEASAASVPLGQSLTLTWSTVAADHVVLEPGIGNVAVVGSRQVSPTVTTTYTLTAVGATGTRTAVAQVAVLGAVTPLPEGTFGDTYQDLIPADATLAAYDPARFALVTGGVRQSDGSPLAGVQVNVHGRPELGTALTDPAGTYTLPIEGGSVITLSFAKEGLMKAQRQVDIGWNDIVAAKTLIMIPADPSATTIRLDGNPNSIFRHRSSQVVDEFGSRAATMIISGDTQVYAQTAAGEVAIRLR